MVISFQERGGADCEQGRGSKGGEEREGDTESEAGPRIQAVSAEPNAGLKLMSCEIVTRAEVGWLTN